MGIVSGVLAGQVSLDEKIASLVNATNFLRILEIALRLVLRTLGHFDSWCLILFCRAPQPHSRYPS